MVTDIKNWSTTASSNTSLSGVSAAEGMAPSLVNDLIRGVASDVREWYEDASWIDFGDTPTRTGATTFTVAGDLTARYHANRRLKATDSSTIYATIASSSFSSPNTTVTVTADSGSLSSSLTAVAIGPPATNDAQPRGIFALPGANSDITSITGLTTALAHTQGGTGLSSLGTANQVLAVNSGATALEFQNAGGGRTISVEQKALGYHSTSSMTVSTLPSNWFISHTLANSANALLIAGYASTYNPNCSGNMYVGIELRQDDTQLTESSAPDSGTVTYNALSYFSSQNYMNPIYQEILIKPGDTSAHNYQLYVYSNTGQQGGATVSWSNAFIRVTEIDGSICTVA